MYDFTKFHKAQGVYFEIACDEIANGAKESHWMWFIFPQLKGLGYSEASNYYGLEDLKEAKAYLADPKLKENLLEICRILLSQTERDPEKIFGFPDNLKLRSSLTLFELASKDSLVFAEVLDEFFGGERDKKTYELLGISDDKEGEEL
jgi:uncharacterized protein (DUF1810 family)